jgi:hypothetical protein
MIFFIVLQHGIWCPQDLTGSSRPSTSEPSSRSSSSVGRAGKPVAATPLTEKQRFITEKYVMKTWAKNMPQAQAHAMLWDAVEARDIM